MEIKICMLCHGPCSDRWKVAKDRYICHSCYKKIFITKEINVRGEVVTNENSDTN